MSDPGRLGRGQHAVVGPGRAGGARPEWAVRCAELQQGRVEVVAVPGGGSGQAGLDVGELLPGQPQGVQPGNGLGVLVPLLAPRAAGGDLSPVDRQQKVVHPCCQRGEFLGVRRAVEREDEDGGRPFRRGAAASLPAGAGVVSSV